MQPPAERIRLIERSMRCFVLGLLSLIPLVGLGLAVLAIRLHIRAWADGDHGWNPARVYLAAGLCLAWVGVLISLLAIGLFVVALVKFYDY
jgi:hypothetical protein